MSLTISLPPETEARLQVEANQAGLSMEEFIQRRLVETELLWRIRTAVPDTETRELHRLLRRRDSGAITAEQRERLSTLLDTRELRGAERLQDIGQLSRLRGISVTSLLNQLGIRPIPTP